MHRYRLVIRASRRCDYSKVAVGCLFQLFIVGPMCSFDSTNMPHMTSYVLKQQLHTWELKWHCGAPYYISQRHVPTVTVIDIGVIYKVSLWNVLFRLFSCHALYSGGTVRLPSAHKFHWNMQLSYVTKWQPGEQWHCSKLLCTGARIEHVVYFTCAHMLLCELF